MSASKNLQWHLKSRPEGRAKPSDFELVEGKIPEIKEGEILVKNEYVSVDPYMRSRMENMSGYAAGFKLDEPILGYSVGKVAASKAEGFAEGDIVYCFAGWQQYAAVNAKTARKIDNSLGLPLSKYIGVLGMTGMTAFVGLLDICSPVKEGETVLVSAAAGAVGSLVGQIAKIKGCRVVGLTSTDDKCALLKSLGYDEAINYKTTENLQAAIAAACPKGIDIYFDNVGGEPLDIAVKLLNRFGRISLCGGISDYENLTQLPKGPNLTPLIGKEAKIQGFIVSTHANRYPEALMQMGSWLKEGKIKDRETVYEGMEKVPEAFIALFEGTNTGKIVVKV